MPNAKTTSSAHHPIHSPGPWRFRPLNAAEFDIVADETYIATVFGTGTQFEEGANARLIAAAPENLEEHTKLCDLVSELLRVTASITDETICDWLASLDDQLALSRKAIAKANGQA